MATVKIVAVGDSNTAAGAYASGSNDEWPYLLRAALATAYPSHTYTVTNRGVSGTTPYDWRPAGSYLPTALADHGDIYAVMLGTNGPVLTNTGSSTDTALSTYEQDMRNIIEAIQATSATNNSSGQPLVVLLSPIPAVDWATLNGPDPYSMKSRAGADFWYYWRPTASMTARRDIVADLAAEYGLPHLDSYSVLTDAGFTPTRTTSHPDMYDGIHMDASGHVALNTALVPVVETLLDAQGVVGPDNRTVYADLRETPTITELSVYGDLRESIVTVVRAVYADLRSVADTIHYVYADLSSRVVWAVRPKRAQTWTRRERWSAVQWTPRPKG